MNTSSIKPSDIDTSRHFWDSFGRAETEVSALWIVRYCQQNGDSWAPFSREAIDALYHARYPGHSPFTFNGLVESDGGGFGIWIVKTPEGLYQVTDDFVKCCYQSSPRKGTGT